MLDGVGGGDAGRHGPAEKPLDHLQAWERAYGAVALEAIRPIDLMLHARSWHRVQAVEVVAAGAVCHCSSCYLPPHPRIV